MFDVFQNVLFGKKKSSAEAEKEKSFSDDFVMVGQAASEQAPPKETESYPSNSFLPRGLFEPSFLPDDNPPLTSSKKQEKQAQIMPLQDVPFILNPNLSASTKLDQIWQVVSQSLASIGSSSPYEEDYDFSLEKSVIAETSNSK